MTFEFKNFLISKYGETITEKLYYKGKLSPENITKASEDKDGQELVKEQLQKLKENLFLEIQISNIEKNWAFDFSGWTGTLDFEKKHIKHYMVIGLEPHIEDYNFQITYELSDKTPDNGLRFGISRDLREYITCKENFGEKVTGNKIWSNLFKLFASETDIQKVKEEVCKITLDEFLNQFYITDLCHFAPKSLAKAVHNIDKWPKTRKKVAEEFLKKEIDFIKPKIIIAQGVGVFKEIKNILKLKDETIICAIPFGKNRKWTIRKAYYKDIQVYCIPHIGSAMTHKTFWIKNIETVKEALLKTES